MRAVTDRGVLEYQTTWRKRRPGWDTPVSDIVMWRHAGYFRMVISTLRFFWRPSGLSEPSGLLLGATGFLAPSP